MIDEYGQFIPDGVQGLPSPYNPELGFNRWILYRCRRCEVTARETECFICGDPMEPMVTQ